MNECPGCGGQLELTTTSRSKAKIVWCPACCTAWKPYVSDDGAQQAIDPLPPIDPAGADHARRIRDRLLERRKAG